MQDRPAQDRPARSTLERPAFERILWLYGGPERDEAFFGAVRQAGFSAVSVTIGGDSSVPGQHGLRFYRDQLSGKGILEMRDGQVKPVAELYERTRSPRALRRSACLASPEILDELLDNTRDALVESWPHGPLAASLGDEASATSHANPLDLVATATFKSSFRAWLAKRFGSPRALAERWNTSVASFEVAEPWTADMIRARELGAGSLPRNLAPWSDQLDFTDELFAGAVRSALQEVKRKASTLPCGLTGLQQPSAYGGHDYARLLPMMSFWEAYDIGGARDLADSLAPRDALQMATLFPSKDGDPALLTAARLGNMLAHGLGGVIVWSAGDCFESADQPTRFGGEVTAAFEAFGAVPKRFGGAEIQRAPVWLVESQASVRAHWMLDSAMDGKTWIRRLSSYEAKRSSSLATRDSWLRLFEDLGIQAQFVSSADLVRRLAAAPPNVLVLPAILALSDRAAAAIRTYVDRGGTLIADWGAGIYDEALRRRAEGPLDSLFGIRSRSVEWRDRLYRDNRVLGPRTPEGLGVAEVIDGQNGGELARGGRFDLEQRSGRGRAVYLNYAVGEYRDLRLDPKRLKACRKLRQRLRNLLLAAAVRPPAVVVAKGLPTCIERVPLRRADGTRLLAVRVNALTDLDLMRQLPKVVEAELVFPFEVRLRDAQRGRDLGQGERFAFEFDVWRGAFFEWEPLR